MVIQSLIQQNNRQEEKVKRKFTQHQIQQALFKLAGDPVFKQELSEDELVEAVMSSESFSISMHLGDVMLIRERFPLLSTIRQPKSDMWGVLDSYKNLPVLIGDSVLTGADALYLAILADADKSLFLQWTNRLRRYDLITHQYDNEMVLLSPLSAFRC